MTEEEKKLFQDIRNHLSMISSPIFKEGDVVRYLKKSESYIQTLVKEDLIPSHKIGKSRYFLRNEIDQWIANDGVMHFQDTSETAQEVKTEEQVCVQRLEDMEIIHEAVNTFGADSQERMLFEEMGELMQAINKLSREGGSRNAVFEEIADVLIMIAQMRFLHEDNGEVEKWIQAKLQRLSEDIQKHKIKNRKPRNNPNEGLFAPDAQ